MRWTPRQTSLHGRGLSGQRPAYDTHQNNSLGQNLYIKRKQQQNPLIFAKYLGLELQND